MGDDQSSSRPADYGTVSGRGKSFTQKEPKSPEQSLRKSIENAVQAIRKNTENLRSIGLRLRTNSAFSTDLHDNINTIIKSTLEIVEQCLSDLRALRLQLRDISLFQSVKLNNVLIFSDTQQRVSVAVNDFQRLSQEITLSLQNVGSGSGKSRRRRKHKYRGFIDSESEGALSDSLGRSFKFNRRMSSPAEQETLIITFPSRQVEIADIESDLQALDKIMNDIKTLSTEVDKSSHQSPESRSVKEIERSRSTCSDQQKQAPHSYSYTSTKKIADYQPNFRRPVKSDKKCCCCCIS